MKWLRIALQTLALVGFVLLLAFGPMYWARTQPMPPDRVAALRVLAVPTPPVAGRDASDAAWLLEYDVPPADRARVAASTRAYFEARQDRLDAGDKRGAGKLVDPRTHYPRFPDYRQARGLCDEMWHPCLPRVRAGGEVTAASLRTHAGQLQAIGALAGLDGLRSGLVSRPDVESPGFPGRPLLLTGLAARFAAGETDAAMVATCRDLAAWRRLGSDTDAIHVSTIGPAYVMQDLRLLAEMLAETPAQAPLPPECTTALAPTAPAELDICPVVRYGFRALPAELRESMDYVNRTGGPWARAGMYLWDPDHSLALFAPQFARFCSDGLRAHLMADRRASTFPHPVPRCTENERIGHPVGCRPQIEALIELDFHDDQLDRRADQAAALALMRTLLWLRERSPDPAQWGPLLPRRPASLGLRRDVRLDADGERLSIPRFYTGREKRFDLRVRPSAALPPLPAIPRKPS